MRRVLWTILGILLLSCGSLAKSDPSQSGEKPRRVSLCELFHNPTSYDGQWVSVRGSISLAFEDFSLYDDDCKEPGPGIWLTFGGDQKEVATFCCIARNRKRSVDLEIQGHQIPLRRDESFKEFLRVLQVQRLQRPDGRACANDECYYYRPITATLVGMFFAGANKRMGGYGHLGCCHLLAINQVSDIVSQRTPVPAGGAFRCAEETWTQGPPVTEKIQDFLSCSESQEQDCDGSRKAAIQFAIDHWRDAVDFDRGHVEPGEIDKESLASWISSDLLTRYRIREATTHPAPLTVAITRQSCVPLDGRAPHSTQYPVACDEYEVSWGDNEAEAPAIDELLRKQEFEAAYAKMADASRFIASEGDESWRYGESRSAALHALRVQAHKWGVTPDETLPLACSERSLEEQSNHLMACDGSSRDGLQTFSLSLQKPKLKPANKRSPHGDPWAVTFIGATICH